MPGQPTTTTELPTRAQRLAAVADRHAVGADRDGVLHRDVLDGILDAGFARHFVPREWGGTAGRSTDLLRATAALGDGCTSAAWTASVIAGAARMGAYLPEQGQRDLWAKGADTVVVGALMPRGEATRTAGGWRLSGRWEFTSGVGFSDWALVCATVSGECGREAWFFALPRREYTVTESWDAVGMRGTAGDTLIADDVFVPEHRGFPRGQVMAGRSTVSRARCHTAPLRLVSGLLFGAPALGAARRALRSWSRHTAPGARPVETDPLPRLTLTRAATDVDAAALLLERAAGVADSEAVTADEALRNPVDCAVAVERLVDTVELLYRTVGSTGQLASNPLQRVWRDVHTLSSHVALRFAPAATAYGEHLLAQAREPGAERDS
ncbi:acyl-CoA dehydrogenase family protein [Streptomyces sp. DH8]|uniref:acyl-CoA dehydrogenase family protein n=1 Tax=Streptomyces sp. DH8 TaxID=2857008 RepID=UPI001E2F6974|nr:acyl-CoA dehydrogenase family protein [Streptomyces sp. DH8]